MTDNVTEYEEFIGRTESPMTVEIRARVSGYLDTVHFKDGADLKQGDPLFDIDPRSYAAEVQRAKGMVEQAKARVARLNNDYDRAMRLVQQKNISQGEADRVTYDRAEAQAAVDSAVASLELAELNLSFCHIASPITGRISRRMVDPGNLVRADETAMTKIVSLDPLYAYFDIDERTLLRLRRLVSEGRIQSSREHDVHVKIGLADEKGFSIDGVINFVDNIVEATTGTLRARAVIANPKNLLSPGLFIRIQAPIGDPQPSLLVPEESIGSDQGQKFVYVVDDENKVVYRPVQVGVLQDRLRVVQSGVKPNDRVIVSGQQRVRPGVTVQPALVEQPATSVAKGKSKADETSEARPHSAARSPAKTALAP